MAETLRLAVASDAAAITRLTRSAYAKWVAVLGREPRPMAADYVQALRTNRFDLLYIDGVPAGLIETMQEADGVLIENVAVAPPFQRRGCGRRLIAHVEQLYATFGQDRIRLYTNALFAGNVALYERLGYRVDREQAFDGGTLVHMSKSLRPDPV